MDQHTFDTELATFLVESLNLQHISAGDIRRSTQIVGGELELDSVDILEVIIALEKKYGVKVRSSDEGKKVFANFGTLADFVYANRLSN